MSDEPINDLEGLNAGDALGAHGPQAYLIQRLSFYGLLGWVLFVVLAIAYVITIAIYIKKPGHVISLDSTGRVIGELQLMSEATRMEADYLAASKRFTEAFLSHNSATVLEDKYLALSMMSEDLREKWRDIWFELNAVNVIQEQKIHCVVLIDDDRTTFKYALNDTFYMSATGTIKCGDSDQTGTSFVFDFSGRPAPVTWNQTSGIEIINLFNNPFEDVSDDVES